MTQTQLDKVVKAAKELMKGGKSTTTLDIKNKLRADNPGEKWYQSDVSDIMTDAVADNVITNIHCTANGVYREFYTGTVTPVASPAITTPASKSKKKAVAAKVSIGKASKATTPKATAPVKKTTKKAAKDSDDKKLLDLLQDANAKKISRSEMVELMKESKGRFYTVVFVKQDNTDRLMNGQSKKGDFFDNQGYIKYRESNGNQRRVNPKTLKAISISKQVYLLK